MNFRQFFGILTWIAVWAFLVPVAHADSWMPPKPSVTYESETRDARFIVTTSTRQDILYASSGALYVRKSGTGDAEWLRIWNKTLQNQVSPVTALVANGGWRVITFDNYYSVGYGAEVIVFYDEKGDLLKKYSLESLLSDTELSQVPRSVSSRWWRSKAEIDETLGLLKVEVTLRHGDAPAKKPISFNLLNGEMITP